MNSGSIINPHGWITVSHRNRITADNGIGQCQGDGFGNTIHRYRRHRIAGAAVNIDAESCGQWWVVCIELIGGSIGHHQRVAIHRGTGKDWRIRDDINRCRCCATGIFTIIHHKVDAAGSRAGVITDILVGDRRQSRFIVGNAINTSEGQSGIGRIPRAGNATAIGKGQNIFTIGIIAADGDGGSSKSGTVTIGQIDRAVDDGGRIPLQIIEWWNGCWCGVIEPYPVGLTVIGHKGIQVAVTVQISQKYSGT